MKKSFVILFTAVMAFGVYGAETPSTVVTTVDDVVNDSDGQISLREAIAYAGTENLGTNITFDAGVFATAQTITLNSTLAITNSLSIDGAGKVILDGGTVRNRSGSIITNGVQIIKIAESNNVALSNLTFQNGYADDNGGAIWNEGVLTVSNSTLSGNSVVTSGGAIYNTSGKLTVSNSSLSDNRSIKSGGAIYNTSGVLTVSNSTLSRNSAEDFGGGAICSDGVLTVSNSTLSLNSGWTGGAIQNMQNGVLTVSNSTLSRNSADFGGAICNYNGSELTVINSTLSGNSADFGGAIYIFNGGELTVINSTLSGNSSENDGGAIYIFYGGELTVINSTLSGNSARSSGGAIWNGNNCETYFVNNIILGNGNDQIDGTLEEFNIISDDPGDVFANVVEGKAVLEDDGTLAIKPDGVAATGGTLVGQTTDGWYYVENNVWKSFDSTVSSSFDYDPTVAGYGLGEGANVLTTAQNKDENGNPVSRMLTISNRFYNVGAYAINQIPETPDTVVSTVADVFNPYDGEISLREAIAYAGTENLGTNITFDAGVFATARTITLNSTLAITNSLSIDGAGKVILDGGTVRDGSGSIITNGVQIIKIAESNNVVLSSLTFQNGFAEQGGAIFNGGTLTVANSTFSGNTAGSGSIDASGGAIKSSGSLTVINSTFSNNTAKTAGGAISVNDTNNGTVLVNSILIGNRKSSDGTADDVSIGGGSASAYFCLLGNSLELSGPGNTYSVSVDNVFYTLDGDSRAVLNADGTFHIKPKELVTNNGCKLQNADGNLQFWRNDTNSWANVYLFPRTMENPIQTALTTAELQTDQLGNNRTEHLVTSGEYSVGAVVLTDTASTIVTTGEDVDDPFDGLVSLREAVEKYAQNNDAITFSGCENMTLNSEITVNKNIIINGTITISTRNSDNVLFKAANGTEKITIGGLVRIENGDFKFGNGTITIQSGNNLVINNDSTLECASFLNNGTLYVKGSLNVVNSSALAYTGNWGQVEYSSTSNQTVNAGTYSTLTFSGSGTKTLTGETTADTIAVKGAENSLITLEGNNKQLSVTTLSASWATIQNVNFAGNTTVNSWNNVIQSNTVDGSGNTNLTINLGGTFSGTVSNELTYGETLKDNANIKLSYSLRRQNAELAVSTDDSLIYDMGTRTETIAVRAAGYTFVNSTTTSPSLDFKVNSKTVSVEWAKDSSYTYNGNDQGDTVSASFRNINGISLPISVAFTGTSETFRNAGDYLALASTTNGNYLLDSTSISNRLTIARKNVTVSGITADDKIYDGTRGATLDVRNVTISGTSGMETLTVSSATGTFDNKDVGTNKTVSISGLTLGNGNNGGMVSNYTLASEGQQETTTASIYEVPSLIVTTVDDNSDLYDGKISLREAIAYAGTGNLGTNITFDAGVFATEQTITLNSTLAITNSLSIDGAGKVILDGGTVRDGLGSIITNGVQIIKIAENNNLALSNLTFQNGFAEYGGAIHSAGALTINHSTFRGNIASNGAAIRSIGYLKTENTFFEENTAFDQGGALSVNSATNTFTVVTIRNTHFIRNRASNRGGAIYNAQDGGRIDIALINCDIHENDAGEGGGVYTIGNDVKMTVVNSTVSLNTITNAANDGAQIYLETGRLDLLNDVIVNPAGFTGKEVPDNNSSLTFNGTLFGTNAAAEDVFVSTSPGQTDLMIKSSGPAAAFGTLVGNILSAAPNAGNGIFYYLRDGRAWHESTVYTNSVTFDYDNADGYYGLAANADPGMAVTEVYKTALNVDEAGDPVSRILTIGNRVYNAGAYAINQIPETPGTVVSTPENVCNPYDNRISLREAIAYAGTEALGTKITFDAGVFAMEQTLKLDSTLMLEKSLSIDGAGKVILDGGTVRDGSGNIISNGNLIVSIGSGISVTLSSLTLKNGYSNFGCGAIYNAGALTVNHVTFIGNTAKYGGAIQNSSTLTVNDSTFSGNTAKDGGGAIYNDNNCFLTVSGSTFNGNTARSGGVIYNYWAWMTVNNSTFVENTASVQAGAVLSYYAYQTIICNSTFCDNTAKYDGAIYKEGKISLVNNIFLKSEIRHLSAPYKLSVYNLTSDDLEDVFANVVEGKAVLEDDGTLAIKSDSLAAAGGTLVGQTADGWYYVTNNVWKSFDATNLSSFNYDPATAGYGLGEGANVITTAQNKDENGHPVSRVLSPGVFGIGAYVLDAVQVVYNAQGGVFTNGAAVVTNLVPLATGYQLPSATRTNYTLLGWYDGLTNNAPAVTNGQSILPQTSHTLYARWKSNFGPVWLNGSLRWNYNSGVNGYFAGLSISNSIGTAGSVTSVKFAFADRTVDGVVKAQLYKPVGRPLSVADEVTYKGAINGKVRWISLPTTDLAKVKSLASPGMTVSLGLSEASLLAGASIPVDERLILLYTRGKVEPINSNSGLLGVENLLGYLVWTESTTGTTWCKPVAAGNDFSDATPMKITEVSQLPLSAPAGIRTVSSSSSEETSGTDHLTGIYSASALNFADSIGDRRATELNTSCRITGLEVGDEMISGTFAMIVEGDITTPKETASLVLLGSDTPYGKYTSLPVRADIGPGTFSFEKPDGCNFFKVKIVTGQSVW